MSSSRARGFVPGSFIFMKGILLLTVVALAFVGCGGSSDKPAAPATNSSTSSGSPLTAPVDYIAAAGKAQQNAIKTVDTTSLNQAIDLFHVDQGRYPKDLNELVEKKFVPELPPPPFGMKLVYDANSGKVSVVKK